MTVGEHPAEAVAQRWDHDYDSDRRRPLLRHGYWPLLWTWARRDFHARYRQSGLRTLWSLWQPLSIVTINGVFFYGVLGVDGGGLPYLAFIVASIMVFRYFSTGLGAATVIYDNANMITKAYFPREIIPLSTLVVSLVDLGAMLTILLGVSWAQGIRPGLTLVALPCVLVLLFAFTIAVTLFVCTVSVFVRDVSFLLPMVSQLIFLGSPIMYPITKLPLRVQWVEQLNPISVVAEAVRDVVLRHRWPPWGLLGAQAALWSLLALAALWYVRALEGRMPDVA